jgi:Fic family protein
MGGVYEQRTWLHDPSVLAPARFRRACNYEAFIPDPIEDWDMPVSAALSSLNSDAEADVRQLNSTEQPALAPFARLLLRTESIASSKVEGMQVDARALARADVNSEAGGRPPTTALEVLGNIDAMQLAIENASGERDITVADIVAIHRTLMRNAPNAHIAGKVRTEQNWIGGNDYNPCGADFVPPPPEDVIDLLADLCRFASRDDISPLMQAAIAHAQFETIHPFADGNGRTGRALVQVIIRRRGLAVNFVPPVSVVLAADKERYIHGLTQFREGEVDLWIESFLASASRAARLAEQYLKEVERLQERWRRLVAETMNPRSDAAVWRLIDTLAGEPVVTLAIAAAMAKRSKPVVNQAIQQLIEVGVLSPISASKRNRVWEAREFLELISGLEAGAGVDESDQLDDELNDRSVTRIEPLISEGDFLLLGPSMWLGQVTLDPALLVRLSAAAPDLVRSTTQPANKNFLGKRQDQEEFLMNLISQSSVTRWLHGYLQRLGWSRSVDWVLVGAGPGNLSEFWFAPFGLDQRTPPVVARCGFSFGVAKDSTGRDVPAVQAAIDVAFSQLPGSTPDQNMANHVTNTREELTLTLQLDDLAELMWNLFDFVGVAVLAGNRIVGVSQSSPLKFGEWIQTTDLSRNPIVNVNSFQRILRSPGTIQSQRAVQINSWPRQWRRQQDLRNLVIETLHEGLENGGYRDVGIALKDIVLE